MSPIQLDLVRSFDSSATTTNITINDNVPGNATDIPEATRERRSLITRRNFYKFIEKKLNACVFL